MSISQNWGNETSNIGRVAHLWRRWGTKTVEISRILCLLFLFALSLNQAHRGESCFIISSRLCPWFCTGMFYYLTVFFSFHFFWHAQNRILKCVSYRTYRKYLFNSLRGAVSDQKCRFHSEKVGLPFSMQQISKMKPVEYQVVVSEQYGAMGILILHWGIMMTELWFSSKLRECSGKPNKHTPPHLP